MGLYSSLDFTAVAALQFQEAAAAVPHHQLLTLQMPASTVVR
jgi:hypothetical protein